MIVDIGCGRGMRAPQLAVVAIVGNDLLTDLRIAHRPCIDLLLQQVLVRIEIA